MPQKFNAVYNLGKIKKSNWINTFEKRNPSDFLRQLFLKEQLKAKKEKEERELLLKQKINKSRLLILYDTKLDDKDSLEYMKFITDETSNYSVIYYNGSEKIVNVIEEQYTLGFRLFCSPTIDSNTLYNYCISLCKKYPDMLLISTNSTTYFEAGILPYNIIRTSSNDKEMITYITDVLLYDLSYLTEDILPQYRYPISDNSYFYDDSGNAFEFQPPLFSKIVYIYTEKDSNGNLDFYSNNYLKQLSEHLKLIPDIKFEIFKIQNEDFTLSQELKNLLAENPVSDFDVFKTSSKTMFILNSSSPEKILSLLDEEYMYDNYFIFSDIFLNKKYTSKYKFNYAIIPSANYSFDGFKLAGIIPEIAGRYISPYIYSINDIILKLLPYYTQHVNQNKNVNSILLIISFIEKLKAIKFIINNNEWYEKKIFTYYVETIEGDETNAQYNRSIFYKYQFNPITFGNFTEDNNIVKLLSDDSNYIDEDPNNFLMNPNSLNNFGWNSRNNVIFSLEQDINTNTFIFDNKTEIKTWINEINKSVGGNRKDSRVNGNNKHTPLIFEIWRSHDPNLNIIETNIEYDLVLDYANENIEHRINKTITINRGYFKNAGINGDIPEENLIGTESEEIIIDETVNLQPIAIYNSTKDSINYCIIKYFKGTKYEKSFNGLNEPYYAPIIINVKINVAVLLTKFKVNDFVYRDGTIGKIKSINNNYKEILIDKYIEVNEIQYDKLYLIKNNTTFTAHYKDLKLSDASLIIDYTDWKVFKKNLFIRSIFMNTIINDDSNQTNILSYNDFIDKKYISQVIKDNLSVTFSTYDNWNKWKELMKAQKNQNKLQTEIFWEMCRSNELIYLEETIDYNLKMTSNRSQVYNINTLVEITRKKFSDLRGILVTEENEDTISIPISFKTSDIVPNDIIQKPIIYVEYFSGHEYETSFEGITENYISPMVIIINIIPEIIKTEYKVNDYVVYYDNETKTEKICKVISVSNDFLYTEILFFDTFSHNNKFYIKKTDRIYNAKQEEIYLYSSEYNYEIINLDGIISLVSDKNININSEDMINSIIIADNNNNLDKILTTYFLNFFNDNIVELIKNNYFITFLNNNIFNIWKDKLKQELIKEKNHTPIFFELARSHNIEIEPYNHSTEIEYKLQMDYLNPNSYNIFRTLEITRKIFNSTIDNDLINVPNETFSFDINFTTQKILPSDILGNTIIYVHYFNGNKYLQYNELIDYYSPLIIPVKIIPIYITDGMVKNEFVVYNKNIYKIINFSENFENIYLQLYSIVEIKPTKIYIKEKIENELVLSLLEQHNILPYKKGNSQELIDITELGIFNINNVITASDNIVNNIVIPDTLSKIITNLDDFNLNKNVFSGIKDDFTITMQNENVLIEFKRIIHKSVTFDKLNHSQLFFEIWRSNEFLLPLIIEIDYLLVMTQEQSKYKIIQNIGFKRNIYKNINNDTESTENDFLVLDIETPLITRSNILNTPLIVVKYFKGHKYIKNFTNIVEEYYSPIIVKINIKNAPSTLF